MDLSLFSDIKSSIKKEAESQHSNKNNKPSKKDTSNLTKKRKEGKEQTSSDNKDDKKNQKNDGKPQTKKAKKENETLLKDIIDLGGSKEDLELIKDIGSDEEIDPKQDKNKKSFKAGEDSESSLLQDLSKFASQLGFAQDKFDERAYDSESVEDDSENEEASSSTGSDSEGGEQEDDTSEK
ncbi:uncharacterized protein SOCG_01650 [Schizosaccharomyces octosporus yFS286]|uniref:Uncharacterized protein n=1 Tax=Schizosaccharomyces octosporus (strain yFS286) TaxID=483514 RepID=S9PTY4_SCHOY|nr:uncharacterized protein SOCG_01650 [Schizosaccharomyces octosporus yFS286]EPX71432.1 hypothetical protein SOCG_01650 [Schizosaccharomyces octosporus yFS286]